MKCLAFSVLYVFTSNVELILFNFRLECDDLSRLVIPLSSSGSIFYLISKVAFHSFYASFSF